MGLFDVFSKGGKYFGKAIEPRCEYCEFGKRASDGNKVLCARKGLVDAGDHCSKFVYSPLKRIPEKQMKKVGWLEGDYDEKNFDELASKKAKEKKQEKAEQPKKQDEKPAEAPAPAVQESAPAPVPAHAPAPAKPVVNDLAALAAAAEAVGDYAPEQPAENAENAAGAAANGLSEM